MSTTELGEEQRELQAENERLRARLAALEAELVEIQARTDAAVGEWQERAYWLDRWHLDLNALMRRPGAAELREALRAARAVTRAVRRFKRRLVRS
jgi:predicted RNase H-like nuclease (RuvC/YqgF family)